MDDNLITEIQRDIDFVNLDLDTSIKLRQDNIHNPYICHLNINSLRNKIHEMRFLASKISPEVITIRETKLDDSFPDAQFSIDGYQNPGYLRKDRNKYGGGLLTFVKKGIPCKRLTRIEPQDFEITCSELIFGKRKWGYIAVYRPPDQNTDLFFNELILCLEQLTNLYYHVVIIGDININTIDNTSPAYKQYENFLDIFNLQNLIKTETCFTKRKQSQSSTSLDVFLTNNIRNFFHTHTIETGTSDCHVLIGSFLRATYHRYDPIQIEYRNYKQLYQYYDQFLSEIKNIKISENVISDLNKHFDDYTNSFQTILNKFAPLKKKTIRGNDGGFANKELRKAWYTKSRLRNIYNKNKTDYNWKNFKKQRIYARH